MGTRRLLVLLSTVLAVGVLSPATAHAGAWAETVLDPPPERVEPAVTYTFGFWVLQHGSYPYQGGGLGLVALTATDEDGAVVRFPATSAVTPGHYAAEVVFPHAGRWTIGAEHGVLANDVDVARVTVPGRVEVSPSDMSTRAPHDWGAVRPSFPPSAPDAGLSAPDGYVPPITTEPATEERTVPSAAAVDEVVEPPVWPMVALGLGAVGLTGGFAVWLGRRNVRANRG
ncbi:hypothetical protein [Actinophytocola gossypii]|uniref:Uncharacterized protein n=1 Tax=Actinophytocola gossypii TaxID=2812003 RepID=A0ABT2J1P5_9PSEU|nr:hypothetical protein [Actinophytocola gossypii]MCT2581686.1 hypothetical protein [Actinophytocola gossypii]